jgi:plastocyanin
VKIADFKFAPAQLTVKVGAKVTFSNSDKAPHTATAQDKSFDTDTLNQGAKKSVTFDKAGTYKYYCSFHRFMEGEIVVK